MALSDILIGLWAVICYGAIIGLPLSIIGFSLSRAHRVCRIATWPRVLASITGISFLLLSWLPFAYFGSDWALAWAMLNLPLMFPFEILAGVLGTWPYILATTIVSALLWATLVYVLCALWLWLRRT